MEYFLKKYMLLSLFDDNKINMARKPGKNQKENLVGNIGKYEKKIQKKSQEKVRWEPSWN